jgi:hypothetical protein
MSLEEKIRQLCDSWIAATQPPGGGIGFLGQSEQYRLHKNNITFPELTYQEFQVANLALSRVLLLKGLNSVIDLDHKLFWAWSAEVLVSPPSPCFTRDEDDIRDLFELCIRTALAGITPPPRSMQEFEQQRELAQLTEFNTQQLVSKSHLVLAYLTPALLEAIVKKQCHSFIGSSGMVLAHFDVPSRNSSAKRRQYVPGKGKCSSLRDLLFLLYENVADADLKAHLDELRQHFLGLDNAVDPFDLVFKWRNESLHGQSSFPTIGGTLLSFAILISMNAVAHKYDQLRTDALRRVQAEMQIRNLGSQGNGSRWSYYPPF